MFEKGKRKRGREIRSQEIGREIRSQEIGVNFFCVDFWMIPLYWQKEKRS